jgi:hypothetical protein
MPGRFSTRKRYYRSCQTTVSTNVVVEHRGHRITGKSSMEARVRTKTGKGFSIEYSLIGLVLNYC